MRDYKYIMPRKPAPPEKGLPEINRWVAEAIDFAQISQSKLSREMAARRVIADDRSIVNKMVKGLRDVTAEEARAIAEITGFAPFSTMDASGVKTTTIIGRAGAATDGRVVFAEGQGGFGLVEIPGGATEDSVAIEIEGYSMGFIADGALVFYTEQHSAPTDDMLGLIVIVGTDEGGVLLKKLLRGSEPGLFDLESINGPMLRDQRVSWAAHIDSIVPPWRAKRLRHEAGEISL